MRTIRFKAEKWVVEGNVQDAKQTREYEGTLFPEGHDETHVAVCVQSQPGWYR